VAAWYQIDIMRSMPNVHVRELPPGTIETLKQAARRHRRSLNAELVDALVEHARQIEQQETLLERLEAVRRDWRAAYPEGFPPGETPEETIRRDRERDDL
jgi:plasmid stability protein